MLGRTGEVEHRIIEKMISWGQGRCLSVWLSSDTSKARVSSGWVTYWKIVQLRAAERCMWLFFDHYERILYFLNNLKWINLNVSGVHILGGEKWLQNHSLAEFDHLILQMIDYLICLL